MSPRPRVAIDKDEELGKRDDDFKPRLPRSSSMTSVLPWRWRKRRTMSLLLLVVLLYVLVQYILPVFNASILPDYEEDPYRAIAQREPSGPPPRPSNAGLHDASMHYYNGPIHFYKLARSLHTISGTGGSMAMNRNVLFVASSTRSAANLIPMACEMARVDRNDAHFALFGRSTIPLDDILMLNGVAYSDCPAFFHDARGDYPEYATDGRMEAATKGAMKHINDFMHPQLVIMDDNAKEDAPFAKAMRAKAKALDKTVIEIPSGRYEDWLWLTRLDALSLANFYQPNVEILIHAPVESSGGLIRLLKSLYNADYRGLKVPRLTIELPSDVEHFLERYLAEFKWPPGRDHLQPESLSVRHRIPNSHIEPEQASIRFVESYWPSNKGNNHVLVLSANVEVSPNYLQYLQFNILEYHAITFGWYAAEDVLGLSLDVPTSLVDGKTPFSPPLMGDSTYSKYSDRQSTNEEDPSPFLYQGASASAILVFGEKWAAFHDFLNKRLQASHNRKTGKTQKVVSEIEPAWVEYLLELMRARGWSILHPSTSFVTVHNDLAQVPEEFARPSSANHVPSESEASRQDESFILSADSPVLVDHPEAYHARDQMPLHQILPFNGELQSISDLPLITHEGKSLDIWGMTGRTEEYVTWFRAAIGGCQGDEASRARIKNEGRTDDLFCIPGVDILYDDDEQTEMYRAVGIAQAIAESADDALWRSSADIPEPTKRLATIETLDEAVSTGGEDDVT